MTHFDPLATPMQQTLNPYALQMTVALIFIAVCVGIAALAHDAYEKHRNQRRGPWG